MSVLRMMRILFRPTSIPAAIAALAVVLFALYADRQNKLLFDERLDTEVLDRVNLIRTKLQGDINSDIQVVRGLVSTVMTEPRMTQARFAELAAKMLEDRSQIRMLTAEPDLVVTLLYPLPGNEKVLGLDFRGIPDRREPALRARDTNQPIFTGPVELLRGGRGFIVRFPVFTETQDEQRRFWGTVSGLIDVDKLYRDGGLTEHDLPIDIAISREDPLGTREVPFFGTPEKIKDRPVKADVILPSGAWHIAAAPKGGWNQCPPGTWTLRLIMLAAGVLVVFPTGLIGRLLDERRRHFAALRDREIQLERLSRRLELALDTSEVGVWEMNLETGELVWDARMNELYNYPADGARRDHSHWRRRLAPRDAARAERDFETAVRTRRRYESQFALDLGNGQSRVIRAIGKVYLDPCSAPKIIGVNWDVTVDVALTEDLTRSKALAEARNAELELARASIEHNALHDFLTKLPNRMYLERVLEEHAARCANSGGGVVLLHVDLDGFKQINDTLGHAAGDAMLRHTASLIRANIREGDFVARTGGDEFVIACNADVGLAGFDELARRLIETVRAPTLHEGHECRFGMSIGIAAASGSEVDAKRLLVNADLALYRAKSLGRNRLEFFSETLQAEIIRKKQTADAIMCGLERGEFVPYYQPQFDARTLELVGVEALVRWIHPRGVAVPPADFISIAEELNVLAALDRTVLEHAAAQFRSWQEQGYRLRRFSVNVSLRRLQDERLVESLIELGIQPGTLAFELVESIYLDESDADFPQTMDRLKELGIEIEIDDFGTGYASIVSLTKLKPRRLKIDRQLVVPIVHSVAQQRLVQSIVDIGKSLDIEIVAEGVETMEHARVLRDLGCDILQGYAFARPMPADELERFMSARPLAAAC